MESQNNRTYPKHIISLSSTLIKLYHSVTGPTAFHGLLSPTEQNENPQIDPVLLLSKVNLLTDHLLQVKPPESGAGLEFAVDEDSKENNLTSPKSDEDQDVEARVKAEHSDEDSDSDDQSQADSSEGKPKSKLPAGVKKFRNGKGKAQSCNTQRNYWDHAEDEKLLSLVEKYGEKWTKIAHLLGQRTGKQVRDRFMNHLRPSIQRRGWTAEEDAELNRLYDEFGNKWSTIAKYLEGRTEIQVKNRFYSAARRQKRTQERRSQALGEEPALNKVVKLNPVYQNNEEMNLKTESFTKSEDVEIRIKKEFSDPSESASLSIKGEANTI